MKLSRCAQLCTQWTMDPAHAPAPFVNDSGVLVDDSSDPELSLTTEDDDVIVASRNTGYKRPHSQLYDDDDDGDMSPEFTHIPRSRTESGIEMFCYEDPWTLRWTPESEERRLSREGATAAYNRRSSPMEEGYQCGLPGLSTPPTSPQLASSQGTPALPAAPIKRKRSFLQTGKIDEAQEINHAGFTLYENDIYLHRKSIELDYHPIECLANQSEVTPGMRAVLVEWLAKVHRYFQLHADSLFLTVNIIDRFLVTTPIAIDCFQLLGITALLIATKQEEFFPPQIDELLRLCSDAYTREHVTELERFILGRLQFDLLVPTSIFFLEFHAAWRMKHVDAIGCSLEQVRNTRALARYLLELTLQDYNLCQFAPSLMSLSSLELADHILCSCTRLRALCTGGYGSAALNECICELRTLTDSLMEKSLDLDFIFDRYMDPYKQK